LTIARNLAGINPEEHLHIEAMASMLYSMASALNTLGRPAAAVAALEESEQCYHALGAAGVLAAEPLIADVLARRGLAQHARGYGASAVLDLDAAVSAYRRLYTGHANAPHALNLARVLAINAVVLRLYGDPDLAVASADSAIRLYNSRLHTVDFRMQAATHARYLQMAAGVASELHAAHGRM
jgi:tetratricopeptide (TPR) repeat protein